MVWLVVWVSKAKHDPWFDGWPFGVAGYRAGVVFFWFVSM